MKFTKTTTICFFLLTMSGCGSNPCLEEWESDKYEHGLCITTNTFPVETDIIGEVIQKLQEDINDTFTDKKLDLVSLFENNITRLGYWRSVANVRGVTLFPRQDPDTGEWLVQFPEMHVRYMGCKNTYYVTGHEMLHIIAEYHLGIDRIDNSNHTVPLLFSGQEVDIETVEGRLFDWIPSLCD